jgi:hypothetical protein
LRERYEEEEEEEEEEETAAHCVIGLAVAMVGHGGVL